MAYRTILKSNNMKNKNVKIDKPGRVKPEEIEQLAYQYIEECINNRKEVATSSGKIVMVRDRHIPTISFFLRIWIPNQKKKTIDRGTYYNWLKKTEGTDEHDTIEHVDELFKALASDIVANEGKGIFYAKNKLGWTDRATTLNNHVEQPLFDITFDLGNNEQKQLK